ncbi:MAG: type IX secretion system membrane protein PorP/SprF [Bacteroidetes bacterium]|jgi:type IX secretion system PorP/SprF family membrane protein|nr:type IX secretion system membrane protein PorP/SprF [Bacteroidota bacterium]MBT3423409.1 type IX secretion system membrane protein PorP/SprF [Bacteroidota bacterium]MBT3932920.1 type IX secretion system membrane protein PorP/SprF [Bacteroidota bacterium]MBT4338631.1 type IX secretion system membrane protein PorP/SprF [Bacteroidota bacterium]MBT4727672.1 type IX secretion system membrane protein PorP/SprF [Bacteroidota bacterium]
MRKLLFAILLLIQGLYHSYGQDPHFTQFYANPLFLNPAMAGSAMQHRVISNYRNQWPNISGAYVTYAASYDGFYEEIAGGLGFQVMYDKAGEGDLSTTSGSFMYSYHLAVSRKFAIKAGLQAQFMQKSIDFSRLSWFDMIEPRAGFVNGTAEPYPDNGFYKSKLVTDFSAGLVGFTEKFYVGVAMHHINQPNLSFYESNQSIIPRKFTAHLGMQLPLDNERKPKHYFSPNVLFMQQHNFAQFNIGAYYIKDFLIAGVWYRHTSVGTEGFMALIGLKKDPFKIGYSYDLTNTDVRIGSISSHEISISIEFKTYKSPPQKKWIKLICPGF